MRIAIVNDSRLAVEALRRTIVGSGHQVAWVAQDGLLAVEQCAKDTPDLVLMDLIMPEMDGVEATRRIMAESPCAILIVTASVGTHSAKVFSALGLGALDAVRTPTLGGGLSGIQGDALSRKIDTIERLLRHRDGGSNTRAPARPIVPEGSTRFPLVVIGASAGGPKALATILSGLPEDFEAGIAIVQHLDKDFAESLASWLDQQCALRIKIAAPGAVPTIGTAWLAGTGQHLVMTSDERLRYESEPKKSPYHPSIDVFFETVAQNWKGPGIGVILTGMGRDGAAGLLKLRQHGHHTMTQTEASSAVWGMPKAAVEAGAAVDVLPLEHMAPALIRLVRQRHHE